MAFLNPTMASAVRTLSSRSRASLKAVSASGDFDVTGTSLAVGLLAAVFACAFPPSHMPRATINAAIGNIGLLIFSILPAPLRQPVEARRPFCRHGCRPNVQGHSRHARGCEHVASCGEVGIL